MDCNEPNLVSTATAIVGFILIKRIKQLETELSRKIESPRNATEIFLIAWQCNPIGHFRVPLCLCFKASLLAEVSHDEAKWNERRETSAGFRRVSYHACPRVSLTTSDVSVTCDTTQRTGLNLSASASGCWIWARAQILNGPIRWNDLASGRLWGNPKRRILNQIFRSLRAFRPAKHTYLEWNLLGFMKLLVFLLRFATFLFEEKAICGATSGQKWSEWFPC